MQLPLEQKWIDLLLELPESGMGYQRVRVKLKDGRVVEDALVYNADTLSIPDEVRSFAATDIVTIEPKRSKS